MSSLPAINTISNGSPADASEVNDNFQTIKTYIDGELIERDGSTPMTGELTLSSSAPSGALVAASKGYVDAVDLTKRTARFRRDTDITMAISLNSYVTFESESNDLDGWWSSGTTLTCPASGVYLFVLRSVSGAMAGDFGLKVRLEAVSSSTFIIPTTEVSQLSSGGAGGDNTTAIASTALYVPSGTQLRCFYEGVLWGASGSGTLAQIDLYITRLALL